MIALLVTGALATEVSWVGGGHASNPQWSADGSWLAFEVNNNADRVDLYVVKVAAGQPAQPQKVVIPGAKSSFDAGGTYAANPNWHPKGPVVFEASNPGGLTRLYYLQPGGGSPAELLSLALAPGNLSWPTLSADGGTLAFTSSATGVGDLYLFSQAQNKVSLAFTSSFPENAPRFAPDGHSLVFSRKSGGTEELFLWTLGAAQPSTLVGGSGDQTRARFVGSDVVYFTNERGDDHWDIAVVSTVPGSTRRILARDIRLPLRSPPQVTPDGRAVVYGTMNAKEDSAIFLTKVDGSGTTRVETGMRAVGDPSVATVGGTSWLAFTGLPSGSADWRQLHVIELKGR
jgi:Tol biopolymer transport system component